MVKRLLRRGGNLRAATGLRRADQVSQSRFGASRSVRMNRSFGACLIELLRSQSQLCLGSSDVACGHGLPNLANLRLDGRFDGAILGPPLQALPMSFLALFVCIRSNPLAQVRLTNC